MSKLVNVLKCIEMNFEQLNNLNSYVEHLTRKMGYLDELDREIIIWLIYETLG